MSKVIRKKIQNKITEHEQPSEFSFHNTGLRIMICLWSIILYFILSTLNIVQTIRYYHCSKQDQFLEENCKKLIFTLTIRWFLLSWLGYNYMRQDCQFLPSTLEHRVMMAYLVNFLQQCWQQWFEMLLSHSLSVQVSSEPMVSLPNDIW